MIEGIFCLLSRQGKKQDKKLEFQIFLACLLVPLSFTRLPDFCLVLHASSLILGLGIGLAISGMEFIGGEIAVSLFELSWWKMLINLQRCSIGKAGSQVLSFSE